MPRGDHSDTPPSFTSKNLSLAVVVVHSSCRSRGHLLWLISLVWVEWDGGKGLSYRKQMLASSEMFPLVFALLPGKSEQLYTRYFHLSKEACTQRQIALQPTTFFIDYENDRGLLMRWTIRLQYWPVVLKVILQHGVQVDGWLGRLSSESAYQCSGPSSIYIGYNGRSSL
jgi:hypothetical protein